LGEARRKQENTLNQSYLQVRLNLILAHLQHKQVWPDTQEVERLAKYIVEGPAIQPIHGTIIT
jgi:hypothetical protein